MSIQDADGAGSGRIESLDAVQQGRLACPVGADESEDLAPLHLEGDVVNCGQVTEPSCHSRTCHDAHCWSSPWFGPCSVASSLEERRVGKEWRGRGATAQYREIDRRYTARAG